MKILVLLIFFFGMMNESLATVTLRYEQSSNFWDVIGKIQNGVSTVDQANALLNQTYGSPVGAEIALIYHPETISLDSFTLREARFTQVGYAVASNPVLPRLFGFEGQEVTATVGWQFLEAYGGRVFGKIANAVSTDLIDRSLTSADNLSLVGGGIHYRYENQDLISFPFSAEVTTRHTLFIVDSGDSESFDRWRLKVDAIPANIDLFVILGQNPTPDFGLNGMIWDYLWQIDTFPDFMSLLGAGVKSPKLDFWNANAQIGFYGGYVGGEIAFEPLSSFTISIHSYGLETTSAYQVRGLRLSGVNLSYLF